MKATDQRQQAIDTAERLMDKLRFNSDRMVSVPRKDLEALVAEFLTLAQRSEPEH